MTRKFGIRRTMTPNQVIAHNLARARALRGWTQEQAADALAPYFGGKLSAASFSTMERSAWTPLRIKVFSADDLLALSRGFGLPIGFFFTPPPPADDVGLHAPDAGSKGLDPIVLLDAILGRPDNRGPWEADLLAYSASTAPMPKSKREKPSVSPSDLAERLEPLAAIYAQARIRHTLGDLDDASDLLERLAEALRLLDDTAATGTVNEPARDDTATKASPKRRQKRSRGG
jgi:hypothetical protein